MTGGFSPARCNSRELTYLAAVPVQEWPSSSWIASMLIPPRYWWDAQ